MKLWIYAASILIAYLYFSSPNRLVVDEKGNIDGITNSFRSVLQGDAFWISQLAEAKRNLQELIDQPRKDQEIKREVARIKAESDADMEKLYLEMPELRPTQAEMEARALRDRADQIEDNETKKMLEAWRQEDIRTTEAVIILVSAKVKQFAAKTHVVDSTTRTFKGYPCTSDCSGHMAGYTWAKNRGINSASSCNGKSNSFREGCLAFAEGR